MNWFPTLLFILIWLAVSSVDSFSQTEEGALMERLIENRAVLDEDENRLLPEWYENQQTSKPDINLATYESLMSLGFLSDIQIINILSYKELMTGFLDIHELQAVPAIDIETARLLYYYFEVNASPAKTKSVKHLVRRKIYHQGAVETISGNATGICV